MEDDNLIKLKNEGYVEILNAEAEKHLLFSKDLAETNKLRLEDLDLQEKSKNQIRNIEVMYKEIEQKSHEMKDL